MGVAAAFTESHLPIAWRAARECGETRREERAVTVPVLPDRRSVLPDVGGPGFRGLGLGIGLRDSLHQLWASVPPPRRGGCDRLLPEGRSRARILEKQNLTACECTAEAQSKSVPGYSVKTHRARKDVPPASQYRTPSRR